MIIITLYKSSHFPTSISIMACIITMYFHHLEPLIINLMIPGGRLNKKDGLSRYGDSHVKDKTS